MFTHKNTYMDMSVRAYFESIRIGMDSGNNDVPSGELDFSWMNQSNDTSYTANAVDNSISIGNVNTNENSRGIDSSINKVITSPESQGLNYAANSATYDIWNTIGNDIADYRGDVGLGAQSQAFGQLAGIEFKNLDDVNIASIAHVLLALKNNQTNWTKLLKELGDYQRITRSSHLDKDDRDRASWSRRAVLKIFKNEGYIADGWLGAQEMSGLLELAQAYQKNPQKIEPVLNGYRYGVDATAQLRTTNDIQNLTESNLESYIAGTYGNARVSAGDLSRALEAYLRDPANIYAFSKRLFNQGVNTKSQLTQLFKGDEQARYRFYHMIDQGASTLSMYQRDNGFDSRSIKMMVEGKLMSTLMTSRLGEGHETMISDKFNALIKDLESQIRNGGLDHQTQEKYLADIRAIDKEKFETMLLRDLGTGVAVNVADGNMGVGAGKTYATPIDGLTATLAVGVGQQGKTAGALFRYGGDKNIGNTRIFGKEQEVNISGGVNAGVGTSGFALFADATVSLTDKLTALNGRDIDSARTHGLTVMAGKGFGMLTYSNLDRRESKINQYEKLLQGFMMQLANQNWSDFPNAIQQAAQLSGAEANTFSQSVIWEFQQFARNNGVSQQTTSPSVKFAALQAFARWKTDDLLMNEVSNTQDMASFGGGAIGIGHAFGITFPAFGLNWYSIKGEFKKSGMENVSDTYNGEIITGAEKSMALEITQESSLPGNLKRESAVNFFLNARGDNTFRKYQSSLTGNNESAARQALISYVNRHSSQFRKATGMSSQEFAGMINSDGDKLSQILTLTSGSFSSRKLGQMLRSASSPAERETIIARNAQMIEKIRKIALRAAEGQFKIKGVFDAYYGKENFKNHLRSNTSFIDSHTNYLGSISYSQTHGKARGLDQLPAHTPLYGVQEIPLNQAADLLPVLIREFKTDRTNQYESLQAQLGVSSYQLDQLLMGNTMTVNGRTIRPSGLKVKLAMSGVVHATCFNGTAFLELGDWTVNTRKVTPFVEQRGTINTFDGYQKDTWFGVTGMGTKKEETSGETTTKTDSQDSSVSTKTDSQNTTNQHTNTTTNTANTTTTLHTSVPNPSAVPQNPLNVGANSSVQPQNPFDFK